VSIRIFDLLATNLLYDILLLNQLTLCISSITVLFSPIHDEDILKHTGTIVFVIF